MAAHTIIANELGDHSQHPCRKHSIKSSIQIQKERHGPAFHCSLDDFLSNEKGV